MRCMLAFALLMAGVAAASAQTDAAQAVTIAEFLERRDAVAAPDVMASELDLLPPVSFIRVRPRATDTVSVGIAALPGEFSSTVRLELYFWDGQGYLRSFCTGTYLGQGLVLTAAHCLIDEPVGDQPASRLAVVDVFYGHPVISDQRSERVEVTGQNVVVHTDYEGSQLANDIALIDVDLELAPNGVPAASLATPTDGQLQGPATVVAGWGRTLIIEGQTFRMELPDRLLYASLDLRTTIEVPQIRADRQAFGVAVGACPGDSGGPLYISAQEGETDPANLRLLGVTSFGTNPGMLPRQAQAYFCVNRGTESYFTSVVAYRTWIDAAVEKLGGQASQLQ